MKKVIRTAAVLATLALLASGMATAGSTEKRVIAIKTSEFELAETDVSHLAIGEAESIVTESGKTIDILRTAEGLEIYVDGELLEMSFGKEHHAHRLHELEEMDCDGAEGDCDFEFIRHAGAHGDGDAHGTVIKKVHLECVSDDEGECADEMVWVSDDTVDLGDIEIEKLIDSGGDVKIIRAHDVNHDVEFEGGELHESHEVIVIREKIEEET